jgi:hypothetical protein
VVEANVVSEDVADVGSDRVKVSGLDARDAVAALAGDVLAARRGHPGTGAAAGQLVRASSATGVRAPLCKGCRAELEAQESVALSTDAE